jgi:hypothetical protein
MIPVKSVEWVETAPERALTLPARYFYDDESASFTPVGIASGMSTN